MAEQLLPQFAQLPLSSELPSACGQSTKTRVPDGQSGHDLSKMKVFGNDMPTLSSAVIAVFQGLVLILFQTPQLKFALDNSMQI